MVLLSDWSEMIKSTEHRVCLLHSSYSKALLLLFSQSVMSNSLWAHELQYSRLPYPSPSPGVCWNSYPLSQWCHPTILFPVIPFHPESFPASRSFLMSWLFASGGQSIGASASILLMNIQGWFPLGVTGLITMQSKGLSRVFSNNKAQTHQFFSVQHYLWSNFHIHTCLLEKP